MTSNDPLPHISEASLDRIEDSVFTGIARERDRRRTRRARWWAGGAAAVAVIAAAALIGPAVLVGPASTDISAVEVPDGGGQMADAPADGATESGMAADDATSSRIEIGPGDTDRELITSATATLLVDDAATSAEAVAVAARARGGWVESLTITEDESRSDDAYTSGMTDTSMPVPYAGSWITVRVPADQLDAIVADLSAIGEVRSSSVDTFDVTEQAIDLRARVEATEASVARLTELLDESADLSDLIAAETALADRQALLESYRQQLEDLEGRVATSSLTVTLVEPSEPVEADPTGFGDGLATGWNGLVATLNGIVIGLGFLLPWLLVVAVVVAAVWLIVIGRRARARRRAASVAPTPEDDNV